MQFQIVDILLFLCAVIRLHSSQTSEIEIYDMKDFPESKISLHMPCEESNMFATKCMCHVKCTDKQCKNAVELCKKYADRGCSYVLKRKIGAKGIATLKRSPTVEELKSFSIDEYPTSMKDILTLEPWKSFQKKHKITGKPGILLSSLVNSNEDTKLVLNKIFHKNYQKRPKCYFNKTSDTFLNNNYKLQEFLSKGIALVALNYQTPHTLVNSLRTWNSSGLLDMVSERLAILNDPLPSELAMSLQHRFEVLQPKDIPKAQMAKPNVLTIGAAFYYSLRKVSSEFVLFLEKDFKMDTELSRLEIQRQLVTAAALLEQGAEIVRLVSKKYQGCGTFKACDHGGIHLRAVDPTNRMRNWYAFYCPGWKGTERLVDDCTDEPRFRCFSSWDSNWTLNAVLVKKSTMLNKKYLIPSSGSSLSIAEIGLNQYEKQDGFESAMGLGLKWMNWRVPVCISLNGLFLHEEIETAA